jgi:hypothetical protein
MISRRARKRKEKVSVLFATRKHLPEKRGIQSTLSQHASIENISFPGEWAHKRKPVITLEKSTVIVQLAHISSYLAD